MGRLTKALKDSIIRKWYIKNRKSKADKIDKDFDKKLLSLLKFRYKENFDLAKKHPKLIKDGWLNQNTSITVSFDCYIPKYIGNEHKRRIDTPVFCVKPHEWFNCEINHKKGDDFFIALKDFERAHNEINEEIQAITNILYSVTTVKKLLEIVPEFDKYLPKSNDPTTALISVKLVNNVKALLG